MKEIKFLYDKTTRNQREINHIKIFHDNIILYKRINLNYF